MQDYIVCRGFDLTEAIRDHVVSTIDPIREYLLPDQQIKVFLSHPARRTFNAKIKVHAHRKEIPAEASHENMYKAISIAANHMKRRLEELKQRIIDDRREPTEEVAFETV
jgi:ribosomal subunit interface protein